MGEIIHTFLKKELITESSLSATWADHELFCGILVSKESISLIVYDPEGGETIRIEKLSTPSFIDGNQYSELVETFLHTITTTYSIRSFNVAVDTNCFAHIPISLFDQDSIKSYLSITSSISENLNYFFSSNDSMGITTVFGIDEMIVKAFKHIPTSSLKWSICLDAFYKITSIPEFQSPEKKVFILEKEDAVFISVCEGNNLLFANRYSCQAHSDSAYFVLLVFRELELNPETTPTIVWYDRKVKSLENLKISQYIRHLKTGERPSFIKKTNLFPIDDCSLIDLYGTIL